MKQYKYEKFDAGIAGSGNINLATGASSLEKLITQTDSSVLPISVSLVYNSAQLVDNTVSTTTTTPYGNGWRLNLQQRLKKVSTSKDDTRYVYTDGNGVDYEFMERYFIRLANGTKSFNHPSTNKPIVRSEIRIDQDNRLWLISNGQEVFAEMADNSGFILSVIPSDFVDSDNLEFRHEDRVRVDKEIDALSRQQKDIQDKIDELTIKPNTLTNSLTIMTTIPNTTTIKTTNQTNTTTFNTLADLQGKIKEQSLFMEQQIINDMHINISKQINLGVEQDNLLYATSKSLRPTVGITATFPDNNIPSTWVEGRNIRFDRSDNIKQWAYNDVNARVMEGIRTNIQFWDTGKDHTMDRARAAHIYQQRYEDKVGPIRQSIQQLSREIETRNLISQQKSVNNRTIILAYQRELERITQKFESARQSLLLNRCRLDLVEVNKQLAQRRYLRSKMILQMPTSTVTNGTQVLGFNEAGNLVMIADNYDNQVSIVYKDGHIDRVVASDRREIALEYENNRLCCIKGFEDIKTKFMYDRNNRLTSIVNANGDNSQYLYNAYNLIVSILPPSRIGIKLDWNNNKVSQISRLSQAQQITSKGVVSGNTVAESISTITYDTMINNNIGLPMGLQTTTVVDSKSGAREISYFRSGELLQEHKQGVFEQWLITKEKTAYKEVSIKQKFAVEYNVRAVQGRHIQWLSQPSTMPEYQANLEWQYTTFNSDDNPVLTRYSSTALSSDNNIRQSIQDSYEYDMCKTGKKPNLIKKTTTVTTTGQGKREYTEQYYYNKQGSVVRTIYEPSGIVEEVGYNDKGLVLKSKKYHKDSPDTMFVEKSELDKNGQKLADYDESGQYKTSYVYEYGTNRIKRILDPKGNSVVFGHDINNHQVISKSSTADGQRNGTEYGYTAGLLTSLTSGDSVIEYSYDGQGRLTSVVKDGLDYITNEYSQAKYAARDGMGELSVDIVTATYASGEVYKSYTDNYDRLLEVKYKDKSIILNTYDARQGCPYRGKIVWTKDLMACTTINYEYNNYGELLGKNSSEIKEYSTTDLDGKLTKLQYTINNEYQEYKYNYDDNKLSGITLPNKDKLGIKLDKLNRKNTIKMLDRNGKSIVQYKYNYYQYKNHATNLIKDIKINYSDEHLKDNKDLTRYVYDANANIKEVRDGYNTVQSSYEYDELNRLSSEIDANGVKTEYGYDSNGNILYKKTPTATVDYEYYEDRLISYNGEKCGYDSLGNPLLYRGKKTTWTHLRSLATYNGVTNSYNASGLRISKKLSNSTTTYSWSGDKLFREARQSGTTTTTLDYIYGIDGIIGFGYNNATYYYVKNIQGDVTAIVNSKGVIQARYTYDAWGNHSVLDTSNKPITDTNNIGNLNPIRYRSYYYDTDLQMYYLKSRYYDPQVGRFINQDSIDELHNSKDLINGLNLYAYCGNNPIMHIDPNGNLFFLIALAAIAVGALVGGAIAGSNAYNNGARGWDLVGQIFLGATIGAAAVGVGMMLIGVGVGALAGLGVLANASIFGITAAQMFAFGALAYNFFAMVVAPILGIIIDPIELETPKTHSEKQSNYSIAYRNLFDTKKYNDKLKPSFGFENGNYFRNFKIYDKIFRSNIR